MTGSRSKTLQTPTRILAVLAVLAVGALACSFGGDGGTTSSGPTNTPGPKVLFKDDFSSSSSGWGTGADDTGSLDYESGQYVFKITKEKWFTWGNLADENFENARIEVEVQNKSGHDEPTFGIICGYQDEQNFYYAGFGSDGYYAIVRTQNNEDLFLTDAADNQWVQSDDISTGQEKYDLALECANGELKLVVDGKTIASVQDDTFKSGQIGLFVLTFDRSDAEVSFDNLRVVEVK
ncbi:MAG: hypothetical protein JNK29_15610 [Anaerolineales bacterium]|nr:hypothetical protein [Anaerolineales bacterium]